MFNMGLGRCGLYKSSLGEDRVRVCVGVRVRVRVRVRVLRLELWCVLGLLSKSRRFQPYPSTNKTR